MRVRVVEVLAGQEAEIPDGWELHSAVAKVPPPVSLGFEYRQEPGVYAVLVPAGTAGADGMRSC